MPPETRNPRTARHTLSRTPEVSIILPARDAADTLERAVRSCLAQSFTDFELILIDDGGPGAEDDPNHTNPTGELARRLAGEDPRIIYTRPNSEPGIVGALNHGLALARAPLIARMDADDYSYPARLGMQVELLRRDGSLAACGCGVRIVRRCEPGQTGATGETPVKDAPSETGPGDAGETSETAATDEGSKSDPGESPAFEPPDAGFARYERWLNSLNTPEEIARDRFIESPIAHPSVMMRREALDAAGGYLEVAWAEDYDLWLRMLGREMKIGKVPETLLDWTDRENRLTRTDGRYSEHNFARAKAHYLARMSAIRDRGVMISGAGPTGKRLARLLASESIDIIGFLDVSPRRIGKRIAGAPVIASSAAPQASPRTPVQLAAVGRPGRRKAVIDLLESRGYRNGIDLFCVA